MAKYTPATTSTALAIEVWRSIVTAVSAESVAVYRAARRLFERHVLCPV